MRRRISTCSSRRWPRFLRATAAAGPGARQAGRGAASRADQARPPGGLARAGRRDGAAPGDPQALLVALHARHWATLAPDWRAPGQRRGAARRRGNGRRPGDGVPRSPSTCTAGPAISRAWTPSWRPWPTSPTSSGSPSTGGARPTCGRCGRCWTGAPGGGRTPGPRRPGDRRAAAERVRSLLVRARSAGRHPLDAGPAGRAPGGSGTTGSGSCRLPGGVTRSSRSSWPTSGPPGRRSSATPGRTSPTCPGTGSGSCTSAALPRPVSCSATSVGRRSSTSGCRRMPTATRSRSPRCRSGRWLCGLGWWPPCSGGGRRRNAFQLAMERCNRLGAPAITARVLYERSRMLVARAGGRSRQRRRAACPGGGHLPSWTCPASGTVSRLAASIDPSRRVAGAGPSVPGAVFRREGDYWTVAYAGETAHLRDVKGLRYLACLLRRPGREVHVLELVREAEGLPTEPARGCPPVPSLRLGSEDRGWTRPTACSTRRRRRRTGAGCASWRRTWRPGPGATRNGPPVPSRRWTPSPRSCCGELAGGRNRALPSPAERARVSVTKAIRKAVG